MISYNFKQDLDDYLSEEITNLGFGSALASYHKQSGNVFEKTNFLLRIKRRIPKIKVRNIYFPFPFTIPDEVRPGFQQLAKAIEAGADLRPFLGRNNAQRMKYNDPLLDDWGIHHFHLGEGFNSSGLVTRSAHIAFAIVRQDALFFLDILNHSNDSGIEDVWTKKHLLSIANKHWPNILDNRVKNLTGINLTDKEHAALRSNNTNSTIELPNGVTFYCPGGGRMSNGESALDYIFCMQLMNHINYKEEFAKSNEVSIRESLCASENDNVMLRAKFSICPIQGFDITIYDSVSKKEIQFY